MIVADLNSRSNIDIDKYGITFHGIMCANANSHYDTYLFRQCRLACYLLCGRLKGFNCTVRLKEENSE